jgi:hypothetical protein
MRVVYVTPTYKDYELLFAKREKIRGGSLHDIGYFKSPIIYQRGSGFFSTVAGLVKRVLPFLRETFLPAAADMAANIAHDYSERRDMQESTKKHGIDTLRKVVKKAIVGGKRRKNKIGKSALKREMKTCCPPDLFQ